MKLEMGLAVGKFRCEIQHKSKSLLNNYVVSGLDFSGHTPCARHRFGCDKFTPHRVLHTLRRKGRALNILRMYYPLYISNLCVPYQAP